MKRNPTFPLEIAEWLGKCPSDEMWKRMLRLDKAENRPKNPPSIFSLDYFSKNGRKKVSEITKLFSERRQVGKVSEFAELFGNQSEKTNILFQ